MTKDEQIKSYMDLLLHTNNLFGWIYDEHMQMLFTTYPGDDYQGFDALFHLQVPPALNGGLPSHPRFIYSFFNLAWLIDFEIVDNQLKKFYVLGPTFTGENSYNELVKAMDQRNLSIKTKANVSKLLTSLPIVASNVMMSYASQLHYLISGTAIDINTIESVQNKGNYKNPSIVPSSQQHHGIWASEQEFLRLFKDGNPDYSKALQNSSHLSNGVKHNPKNSLRAAKNNAFVLLTLISRAAIEGGVSPNVAYDLCDFYGQRIEDSVSLDDNGTVIEEMQTVYFQKVCEAKHTDGISPIVKNCCDYIGVHINEKLSIGDLAERAGYSEYYFSRKFKQEMGCTITEYIMREKIERAKVLLSTTNMSILDISIELSFNSRSYFSDSFQKIAGIAPGEYRKQNIRL